MINKAYELASGDTLENLSKSMSSFALHGYVAVGTVIYSEGDDLPWCWMMKKVQLGTEELKALEEECREICR